MKYKNKWNLKKIYTSIRAWELDFQRFSSKIKRFNKIKDNIHTANDVLAILTLEESIDKLWMKLYTYTSLSWDVNKNSKKFKEMSERLDQKYNIFIFETSSMEDTILKIPRSKLTLFTKMKKLEKVKVRLDMVLERKSKHTRKNEYILQQFRGIFDSFSNLHRTMENKIKFPKLNWDDGRKYNLNHQNISRFERHPNREIRKKTYQSRIKGYNIYADMFADLLRNHLNSSYSQTKFINNKNQNTKGFLESTLGEDELTRENIQDIIDISYKNKKLAKSYFDILKKQLKIKTLYSYDSLAQIGVSKKNSFSKGVELFLESIEPLGEEYQKVAIKAFKEGWVDAAITKNKFDPSNWGYSFNSGIFSPYVFLQYEKDYTSLTTLVHEMGHAIHGHYMNKNNHFYRLDPSFIIAESVSFTHELLLNYTLFDKSKTQKSKKDYLFELIKMYHENLYLKTMDTEFELFLFDCVEEEDHIKSEILTNKYFKIQKKFIDPFVKITPKDGCKWMMSNTYYESFYQAKYIIAFACAIKFAKLIYNGDIDFINKFKLYLSKGSHFTNESLLSELDIDTNDLSGLLKEAYLEYQQLLQEYNQI